MTIEQPQYVLVPLSAIHNEPPTIQELKKQLEKGNEEEKIDAMKNLLVCMANGELYPDLLMFVIRFVMPTPKNKEIKKLLLLYFELCEKLGQDGKLKQEMILVCNALRNDLQHPNEYVRGATLRLVPKLKEVELLEPLVPSIRSCLEHRHAYVRRQAVLAIAIIFQDFSNLIPDAPELLSEFLSKESDTLCCKTAILSLSRIALPLAVAYIKQIVNKIETLDEPIQLAILQVIRIHDPEIVIEEKPLYLHITATLSTFLFTSSSVKYACAQLLPKLSSIPSVIRQALSTYIALLSKESDNSIRLVVLDCISELYQHHSTHLESSLIDLLATCSTSSDITVVKRTIDILTTYATSSILPDIVEHMRKDLEKSIDDTSEQILEYRHVVISSLIKLVSSENVALKVSTTLTFFLTDKNAPYLADCAYFLRHVSNKYEAIGDAISNLLLDLLPSIKGARIYRACLWIIGEYSKNIDMVFEKIQFIITEANDLDTTEQSQTKDISRILPDGTYASENASCPSPTKRKMTRHVFFEHGNVYVPASIAMALTKLVCRLGTNDNEELNRYKAKGMLLIAQMLKIVSSNESFREKLNSDSMERMATCLRILSAINRDNRKNLFVNSKEIFGKAWERKLSSERDDERDEKSCINDKGKIILPGNEIEFQIFDMKKNEQNTKKQKDQDLCKLIESEDANILTSRLDRVFQLTGFSDAIFAEAYIDIDGLDVVLDIILVNQGEDTLRNICLEFISSGGYRSLFKPSGGGTLGPFGFANVKAIIHIQSAEQGVLQGCISYDAKAISMPSYQMLNAISLDVWYFLKPAICSDAQFSVDWRILEWENKIHIKSKSDTFSQTIRDLCKLTNFKCISPSENELDLSDSSDIFSANLFAKSKFEDDVLANVSLEKLCNPDEPVIVTGHIRIRSKSNGLAFILGNKISQHMG